MVLAMSVDPFENRVAVITGGGGGIGSAMARAFAARGARVALADRNVEAAGRVAKELQAAGGEAEPFAVDVTDRDDVFRLAEAVCGHFGGVHIVCNNAGIALGGEMWSAPTEDWEYTMGVNFWGVLYGVQAFVPRILEHGEGGHVVNTASMAGLTGMSFLGMYCASKFAVVGLTESLARELKPRGVGVSVLCPMIVQTDINANTLANHPDPERRKQVALPQDSAGDQAPPMRGGVIQADSVATRVVAAIEGGDLYILTHPEQQEILRRRHHRIDEAAGRANSS
jgi:NAD(P)-dependent dehydrogenase (short-subunit alcohol dehydrogenase family)